MENELIFKVEKLAKQEKKDVLIILTYPLKYKYQKTEPLKSAIDKIEPVRSFTESIEASEIYYLYKYSSTQK